jgi:penicillin-binding protein 1A
MNKIYHNLPDEDTAEKKPRPSKSAKSGKGKRRGKKQLSKLQGARYVFTVIGTTFLTLLLIIIITVCIVAVALSVYITQFAESMHDVDLKDIELSYSSFVFYKNPDYNPDDPDCEQEEYIELFALSADENRIWVDLEEIPQHTIDALVSSEDKRFYEHAGVDWSRTISIMVSEMLGSAEKVQGGSTITQQLVRDITKDNQVNIGRKLREIFRAISFEQKYSKHDILENYLNRVAFGNTVYGVGSAARHYFDKEVNELTVAESGILMGLLPSPVGFNPYTNPRAARERQIYSLGEMFELGFISYAQYQNALNEQVEFRLPISPRCRCPERDANNKRLPRCDGDYFGYIDERYVEYSGIQGESNDEDEDLYFRDAEWEDLLDPFKFTEYQVRHNWYVDAALKEITADLAQLRDISYENAAQLLRRGGFKIYLSMDIELQEKMEKVFEDPYLIRSVAYPAGTPARNTLQGAFVLMDMQGNVVALAGGVGDKPGNDAFNRATQARRNIGSTIKPFGVYAPAVDMNKITYSSMLMTSAGRIGDPNNPQNMIPWPQNFEGDYGAVGHYQTAWAALMKSTNTVSSRTMNLVGLNSGYSFLEDRLGFTTLNYRHLNYSSLSTGSVEMKLHEVTAAYQIFGTGGVYYKPAFYSKVEDHRGEIVLEKCKGSQAIGADSAWVINRMMDWVVRDGGGSGQFVYRHMPRHIEIVGKTGTANDMSDLLFGGLTPDYVGVVRIGFDDNRPMSPTTAGDWWIPPTQIWGHIMSAVIPTDQPRTFDEIGASSGAITANYCGATGLLAGIECANRPIGYFKADNIPPECHGCSIAQLEEQEAHPIYG